MKNILKYVAWTLGIATLILSLVILFASVSVHSYNDGQLDACNRSLLINPYVDSLMLYCELENMDVYIKSGVDRDFRWKLTKGAN